METLWQDLKYGARQLARNPGFTIVAVLTLALGIGANTAIFSVVNAVLLRPFPYREADRVMVVVETLNNRRGGVTAPNFVDWREQNTVFEKMGAATGASFNLTGEGDPERLPGALISADYFPVLGVQPILGRLFLPEEDRPEANRVVLLSHALWQRRYGAAPTILGQTVVLDREPYTVVGVMPRALELTPGSSRLWVPLALGPRELSATGSHTLRVIARLKAGVSPERADAEMKTIAKGLEQKRPWSNTGWSVTLIPLPEQLVGNVRSSLLILLAAVGFVLLIACANVANLLLARAAERHKEMGIRIALGARRWHLLRQLLVESVLLFGVGAAVGLLFAYWGLDALSAGLPDTTPRLTQSSIDLTVLAFTLAVSVLTGVLFGLAPGLQASKTDPNDSLKEGARSPGHSPGRRRLRNSLVVSEVAASLVLLIAAGLLAKSFWLLHAVEPGFNPANLKSFQVSLPEARYPKPTQVVAFYQRVLDNVAALPGVDSAALASNIPLADSGFSLSVMLEGQPALPPDQTPTTFYRAVSNDYFRVMGIRQLRGRSFSVDDREGAVRVGIVNQTMATRLWPGQEALGQRFRLDDNGQTPVEVVGVVADVRHFGLDSDPRSELFIPYTQAPPIYWDWANRSLNLVVRQKAESAALASAVRGAIWSVDGDLPVYNVTSLDEVLEESVSTERVYTVLLSAFGVVALALAVIGVYGLMAYSVTQRTHEIGLRVALGARPRNILALIVSQGLVLVALGVGVGFAAAFGLTRFLGALLFGVSTTDALTFISVAVLLVLVALLACYLPARRAMRVDPMTALRYE